MMSTLTFVFLLVRGVKNLLSSAAEAIIEWHAEMCSFFSMLYF